MGGNPRKASGWRKGRGGGGEEDLPLHAAARAGDIVAVRSICSSNPLAVNARDKHSRTPLHLAAWSGQTEVVSYLCKHKADVGAAAMDDMGAIHFASQKGHLDVVRELLSSGVSIKAANRKGLTPLHYAVRGSHLELVKYLIRKGASLSAKTKAGETPLDLANSDEVRAVFVECEQSSKEEQTTGSKNVKEQSSAHERDADSKAEAQEVDTNERDADLDGDGFMVKDAVEGEEHEEHKRKIHEAEAKEDASRSKKARVALGHLLAEDDMEGGGD